ncbi:MAG: CsgG/HfaB family protein [Archangium sp.]|nr:CsgG/HfaB family protein [Archangium sp.]MDP3155380.1 CsgG/HfaB family protein [Archangium sp.]MDP3573712.1 CsgG/HfaB family protein [Archangium sp.]
MLRLAALLLLAVPALAATPDAGVKPRVAVLYFDASTTDADLTAFTKGLAALLITDFTANPALKVLEREKLEDAIKELDLGQTKYADKSTFARLGKILGVEYLVIGNLVCLGKSQCRIVSRVMAYPQFDEVTSAKVMLDPNDIYAAEEKLVEDLSQKLVALGSIAAYEPPEKRNYKLTLSTGVKYARALDAKDKKDPAAAKKLLAEVVKEQPGFKLAQLDLLSLRD